MKIYVGNLSYKTTEEGLSDYFAEFGNVEELKIIQDRETGRSKGFAFVTFATKEDAEKALAANGQEFDGRRLKVNPAQDKKREKR